MVEMPRNHGRPDDEATPPTAYDLKVIAAESLMESYPTEELREMLLNGALAPVESERTREFIQEEFEKAIPPDSIKDLMIELLTKNLTLAEITRLEEVYSDPEARAAMLKLGLASSRINQWASTKEHEIRAKVFERLTREREEE